MGSTSATTAISTAPELASSGLPEGQELEILETVRDKVPAEVFTTPYQNPVGGNPEAVRANLRESAKLLKEAGFEVRDRKLVDAAGKPVTVEILVQDPSAERIALFLQAVAGAHRHHDFDPHRRRRAVPEPAAQFRLRHHHRPYGGSRCRPATSSANSGDRRPRISPAREIPRHQESRRRCADRQNHLRQGPRRTGGGYQGARPRAAVEFLRRAAIYLSVFALRALGPLQPCRAAAEIRPFRPPDVVVVRRREGRQDRQAHLEGSFAHGARSPAGMCWVSASAR